MITTRISAHEEHRRAAHKHEQWLAEIDEWKADHSRAVETLERAREFVIEHDALLDHHAQAIAEHDRQLKEHEAALAASGDGSEGPDAAAEHQRLEEIHRSVLEQHNRFKGRHPALMQEITRLAVELHKVSHAPG